MSFDERMKEINSWAIPLEGTPERKWLDKRLAIEREQNPEIQKKIRSTIVLLRVNKCLCSFNG